MPANSFQNAQTPDGKYAVSAGELHLFDEGDRNTDWDVNVNPTTSWVEHDLSGRVPKGTKALFGHAVIVNADAQGTILIRDGNSAENDKERTQTLSYLGAAGKVIGVPIIIKASDGIFDIRENAATVEIAIFTFEIWGYFL